MTSLNGYIHESSQGSSHGSSRGSSRGYVHLTEGIFTGCGRMIEHLLYRMRIPENLLDDARQEAYIGVMKAQVSFDPAQGAKFLTYATYRAHGAVGDWMATQSKGIYHDLTSLDNLPEPLVGKVTSVDEHLEEQVLCRELHDAIDSLSSHERRVMKMILDGRILREIGDELGKSLPWAGAVKLDAIKSLRKKMVS